MILSVPDTSGFEIYNFKKYSPKTETAPSQSILSFDSAARRWSLPASYAHTNTTRRRAAGCHVQGQMHFCVQKCNVCVKYPLNDERDHRKMFWAYLTFSGDEPALKNTTWVDWKARSTQKLMSRNFERLTNIALVVDHYGISHHRRSVCAIVNGARLNIGRIS